MQKPLILLLLLFSFQTFAEKIEYTTDLFCQDLSVVLQRVNMHANNIANLNTTRTPEGGPYQRRIIKDCNKGVCKIVKEDTPPVLKYIPSHPDANEKGYVASPSFSKFEEIANLKRAQNMYETIFRQRPNLMKDLLASDRYKGCFKKYKYLEIFNYKKYFGRETLL